eukprot:857268-Karenia_brevis.AAC.1
MWMDYQLQVRVRPAYLLHVMSFSAAISTCVDNELWLRAWMLNVISFSAAIAMPVGVWPRTLGRGVGSSAGVQQQVACGACA